MQQLAMKTTLLEHLRHTIDNDQNCMPFDQFMALVLYHPEFGYYNSKDFAIGREGAFVTAPEISPLFAQCFAKQCLQLFDRINAPYILELGAGSGRFALEILKDLEKTANLPQQYYIYDISDKLRKKQQTFLSEACPQFMSRIIWLDAMPSLDKFSGVIIANEVLDALPVHCFRMDGDDGIKEKCVAIDHKNNENLIWKIVEINNDELSQQVNELHHLYDFCCGYESEINLHLKDFIKTIAQALHKGVILFADYGYGQREYYHPERLRGTLATIYQGHRLDDPLQYPGQQDITAHVDFTRVAEYALDEGFELLGYTTQASFLLGLGLMDLALRQSKNLTTTAENFHLHQAIKYLTLPTEMGERVKVMALGKNMDMHAGDSDTSLSGFQLKDNRREL